jgi:hypothetical protein
MQRASGYQLMEQLTVQLLSVFEDNAMLHINGSVYCVKSSTCTTA